MQNSQIQTTNSEYAINMVWNFMNRVRGKFSMDEIFSSALAVLYVYHKGYSVRIVDNHRLGVTNYQCKLTAQ